MTSFAWRVGAIGDGLVPWCIPLADGSTVGDLRRAVEARQNKRLNDTDKQKGIVIVEIQLKVDGELYAVDPDDLLLNLFPKDSKGAMFVAVRVRGGSETATAESAGAGAGCPSRCPIANTLSPNHSHLQDTTTTVSRDARGGTTAVAPARRKVVGVSPPAGSSSTMINSKSRTRCIESRSSGRSRIDSGSNCETISSCQACHGPLDTSRRPSFCCRVCNKLFHPACVGYDTRKRQFPPPAWICPRCPDGERGPSRELVHESLKRKGTVTQVLGNQQWCPICLHDNRAPGMVTMGSSSKRCLGCGLHTHAHCRARLTVSPSNKWPCDECQRRSDGVIPGDDNPVWRRLKGARLDGGFKITTSLRSSEASILPARTDAADSPNLEEASSIHPCPLTAAAGVGSPNLNQTFLAASVTPASAARSRSFNQAMLGPPIAHPAAGLQNHRGRASSSADPAVRSYDTEEAAAVAVTTAAASFVPAQCVSSSSSSQSLASSATASRVLPSRISMPTSPSPPPIKTEVEDQDAEDSDKDESILWRRYPKRAKVTAPDQPQPLGFRHEFDWQTAENMVLVPIMLHGTSEQQNGARDFISTQLSQKTQEACDVLIEKFMVTANKDNEGISVHRTKLIDLCSTDGDIVRYLLGPNTQDSKKRVANKFKVLANLTSSPGSKSQLYSHNEGFEYSLYFVLRE